MRWPRWPCFPSFNVLLSRKGSAKNRGMERDGQPCNTPPGARGIKRKEKPRLEETSNKKKELLAMIGSLALDFTRAEGGGRLGSLVPFASPIKLPCQTIHYQRVASPSLCMLISSVTILGPPLFDGVHTLLLSFLRHSTAYRIAHCFFSWISQPSITDRGGGGLILSQRPPMYT